MKLSDFKRLCPAGCWTCEDGREVLFNSLHWPILERYPGEGAKVSNPDEVVQAKKRVVFFNGWSSPWLALVLLLLTATPGVSSTMELARAVSATMRMNVEQVDPASRRETAEAMRAYWQSFSDRLPRLSPSEVAWLERERSGGPERTTVALNSREQALWYLAGKVDHCLKGYNNLLTSKKLNRDWEAYFWVRSLQCYTDYDLIRNYLMRAGLSNGLADGPFAMPAFSIWTNYIIEDILPTILLRER